MVNVWLTIPLVLWVLAASSVSAATIQFEASVDRTRASQSEPIRLTLRITSDEQLGQVPPAFDLKDFHVEGPATSTRMEMRNTNITFSRELTYVLYAKQTGTFTIGPLQLEMDGEYYQTKPITLEIVRGTSSAQTGQADKPIFVLARADHERAYVGQQVTVSYDLFYRIQPHNVSFNKLPTFVGFWTEDLFIAQQLDSHQEVRGSVSF
ncbi:MAG: protein BatD, partial [Gemmatimonadetes bacterium]|nr:protein BatD [Gemmatimonadota bacterium]